MKSEFKILLVSMILSNFICAQSMEVIWDRSYGGSNDEGGGCVLETDDRGYLISGYTKSFGMGESDTWLLRTDENGDTIWTKTFGGSNYDWNQPMLEIEGGYIQLIRSYSYGNGGADAWIIRTDLKGDTVWSELWGEAGNDWLTSVKQTDSGDLVFCGRTSSFGAAGEDVWIVQSDSLGEIKWNKTYGYENTDNASSLALTADGGFIVVGRTYLPEKNKSDIWLLKFNENGDTLWTKTYGEDETDYGVGVIQTNDGYLIVGNTSSFTDSYDIWLIKTDLQGDTLWTKFFGGDSLDRAFSLESDGENFMISGVTFSYGNGNGDAWFIIVNENGEEIISATFGGEYYDYITDCKKTFDGNYIITGQTTIYENNSQLWLMKVSYVDPVGIISTSMNQEYQLNQNYPNPFNPITTIKYLIPSSGVIASEARQSFEITSSQGYPTGWAPRNDNSNVTLKIYDILGREIATLLNKKQEPGNYEITWDASEQSSGIYFYQLQAGSYILTKKMILLR